MSNKGWMRMVKHPQGGFFTLMFLVVESNTAGCIGHHTAATFNTHLQSQPKNKIRAHDENLYRHTCAPVLGKVSLSGNPEEKSQME